MDLIQLNCIKKGQKRKEKRVDSQKVKVFGQGKKKIKFGPFAKEDV